MYVKKGQKIFNDSKWSRLWLYASIEMMASPVPDSPFLKPQA